MNCPECNAALAAEHVAAVRVDAEPAAGLPRLPAALFADADEVWALGYCGEFCGAAYAVAGHYRDGRFVPTAPVRRYTNQRDVASICARLPMQPVRFVRPRARSAS